jgi:hypothetical protein
MDLAKKSFGQPIGLQYACLPTYNNLCNMVHIFCSLNHQIHMSKTVIMFLSVAASQFNCGSIKQALNTSSALYLVEGNLFSYSYESKRTFPLQSPEQIL